MIKTICIIAYSLTAVVLAASDCQLWQPPQKKLIQFGWGAVTPELLRDHLKSMEAESPYDGFGITLTGKRMVDGKQIELSIRELFQNKKIYYSDFKESVEILKQVKSSQFTHIFINTVSEPGNVDWFDDAAWKTICENFAVMSRIAKETGCKGLRADFENYHGDQFAYKPAFGHSYEDTWNQARLRGRQWITAIGNEFPDMTLFCFFWFSQMIPASIATDMQEIGKTNVNGLFAAYLNGIYDALPAQMKIVDGNEWYGYKAGNYEKFIHAAGVFQLGTKSMLAPENLDKAAKQTQLGYSLYLEAYFPEHPGFKLETVWHLYPNATTTDRLRYLRRNLYYSLLLADEYVWTWCERGGWWKAQKKVMWETKAPGINQAMRSVKNIDEFARQVYQAQAPNLITGGDFEAAPEKNSAVANSDQKRSHIIPWSIWEPLSKNESSAADFLLAPGQGRNSTTAAVARNFRNGGVVTRIFTVHENEFYFLHGYCRMDDFGQADINIYWKKDVEGPWLWDKYKAPVPFITSTAIPGSPWREFKGMILVPEGVSALGVVINIGRQRPGKDAVFFDDFELRHLPLPNDRPYPDSDKSKVRDKK